jgi:DivIVA domain-containing protein
MAESERRQRVISSTPRLSVDDVANRAFATGMRGYSTAEVRSFLRRVSEELASAREREEQLVSALDDLEEQLHAPRPLDEQQLLDALGEETARLLRTAREAADDIRNRAEERSTRVMEEAQTEAHRLRTDAQEILGVRTQEAEGIAAEIVGEAESRAAEIRATNERTAEEQRLLAETEAAAIVESARQQGREMLDEARAARERVLVDLGRRRNLLQGQVEELRQGRDRLLDAYRVVKRTFLDATEALAQVEARAVSGRTLSPEAGEAPSGSEVTTGEISVDVALEEPVEEIDTRGGAALADVDSLFARIRAGHHESAVADDAAAAPGADAANAQPALAPDESEPTPEIVVEPAAEPDAAPPVTEATPSAADAWREQHRAAVAPLLAPLVKAAKRSAQDEQNALLDAVRRHKGRPSSEQVLADRDTLVTTWAQLMRSALDEAYTNGRVAAGAAPGSAPDPLLQEAAGAVTDPLRERIALAIDDGDVGDTSGLVERIGARYREWKNQQLDHALGDALVVAWSRGVYDGTSDGGVLQWVPLVEGRCADCDDNALEPTVKGSEFPTGQPHPPAHPGCRCLLAPADAVAAG